LPVAIRGGGSWLTTVKQIGSVLVAIFEVFCSELHTAGTHAGNRVDVLKLIEDVCSRIVLLYEEYKDSLLAK
jgi:hypothetical protein